MAGYRKIYVVGGQGGYMGADGVNPIEFMLLVGDSGRQWIEPLYVKKSITPLGSLTSIIPEQPDSPDSLLDACIAFAPEYFRECPALAVVRKKLQAMGTAVGIEQLDFDLGKQLLPQGWEELREEARVVFGRMNVWVGKLQRAEFYRADAIADAM